MGVDAAVLLQELAAHNTLADAAAAEAEAAAAAAARVGTVDQGGAHPPPRDVTGKRYFHGRVDVNAPVWVARVMPVVHYCMGGIQTRPDAAVLGQDGAPLHRVWAAGEVSGGLHGRNRLGGNSLAECAVFGRVAGRAAAAAIVSSTPVAAGQQVAL
jgi:succinate dehydrogenase/fumarate reductase flavoprotein subunit